MKEIDFKFEKNGFMYCNNFYSYEGIKSIRCIHRMIDFTKNKIKKYLYFRIFYQDNSCVMISTDVFMIDEYIDKKITWEEVENKKYTFCQFLKNKFTGKIINPYYDDFILEEKHCKESLQELN